MKPPYHPEHEEKIALVDSATLVQAQCWTPGRKYPHWKGEAWVLGTRPAGQSLAVLLAIELNRHRRTYME